MNASWPRSGTELGMAIPNAVPDMKTQRLLTLFLCLLTTILMAQTPEDEARTVLRGDAATDWNILAHTIQSNSSVTAEDILHPEDPQEFPPNMMDTLLMYDWVKVGNYWYKDNSWMRPINEISHQTFAMRYFDDGSHRDFYGVESHYVTPAEVVWSGGGIMPPTTVGEKWGYTWLFFDYEKNDALRLVSYRDGLLIIDNTDGGERNGDVNYHRRFRNAYIKMPKIF